MSSKVTTWQAFFSLAIQHNRLEIRIKHLIMHMRTTSGTRLMLFASTLQVTRELTKTVNHSLGLSRRQLRMNGKVFHLNTELISTSLNFRLPNLEQEAN